MHIDATVPAKRKSLSDLVENEKILYSHLSVINRVSISSLSLTIK